MTSIAKQLGAVRARIAAAEARFGRASGAVQLIAVSKTFSAEAIRAAYAAGQTCFGESYVQEALVKIEQLRDCAIEWHFIGPVQSNKTRDIAQHFAWVHSVDRLKTAQRLSDQRMPEVPPLNICIQVNISSEMTKSGVSVAELPHLARDVAVLPRLRLRGLMAIPAPEQAFERQRAAFACLRTLFDQLRADGLPLDTLSMGMSDDLEAAVAEGATMVRVGTAVFGGRKKP